MFKLSRRSRRRLKGVHPDMVKVVEQAIEITEVDFGVGEGVRSLERQKILVEKGASKTMNSRHLLKHPRENPDLSVSHAVDLVAYIGREVMWDWPLYHKIAAAMKQAAIEQDIALVWGGDFKGRFKDGPHFQLSWKKYPIS